MRDRNLAAKRRNALQVIRSLAVQILDQADPDNPPLGWDAAMLSDKACRIEQAALTYFGLANNRGQRPPHPLQRELKLMRDGEEVTDDNIFELFPNRKIPFRRQRGDC